MKHINMLIKPASGNCNLRCRYCFYHDITKSRTLDNRGFMDLKTLKIVIKKALEAAQETATFAFQGGEPTLSGLDFYKAAISYQKEFNCKNLKINNALQTNGVCIDDEWAAFLSENRFLTGLSLDGPKDIHDFHRLDAKGFGSFQKVMQAAQKLEKHGAEYNLLTVVHRHVAKHIRKILRFFEKNDFRYLQFIPCLDPIDACPGQNPYSLTPALYAFFLKESFDFYYRAIMENRYVSIRFFDNQIHMLNGQPPESCGLSGVCVCQYVIEGNGDVYPCDFYCLDEYCIGNIHTHSPEEMFYTKTAQEFIKESFDIHDVCRTCEYFSMCRGGCKRYRIAEAKKDVPAHYYCSSFRDFYKECLPKMQQLARMFQR